MMLITSAVRRFAVHRCTGSLSATDLLLQHSARNVLSVVDLKGSAISGSRRQRAHRGCPGGRSRSTASRQRAHSGDSMKVLHATATVLVLVAARAWALDLPVSYRVDARELKRGAVAGDQLVFELHDDSACTILIHSETLDVADVDVLVEQLKTLRIKGAPKQPKIARINVTLPAVTPTSGVFLRVSGAGVLAVGDACQARSAGMPGPIGPAGPEGPRGPQGEQGPSADFGSCVRRSAPLVAFTITAPACSGEEAVTGGGLDTVCGSSIPSAGHISRPLPDISGWEAETGCGAGGTVYAVCCK